MEVSGADLVPFSEYQKDGFRKIRTAVFFFITFLRACICPS